MHYLRDYQQEDLRKMRAALDRGCRKQLHVLPTGTGKTVCFAHVPQAIDMPHDRQMIVLVHRIELVKQAAEKLQKYNPSRSVGVERADQKTNPDTDLIVASVATIGRLDYEDYHPRLKKFNPEKVSVIIIDEAHHAAQEEGLYANILRYFGVYKPDPDHDWSKALLAGYTATPNRADGKGLEVILDEVTHCSDLRAMISSQYLADVVGHRIDTQVDISQVKRQHGDYVISELGKAVNTPERNQLVVDNYVKFAPDTSAIAFTVDVQHAHDLAETFRDNGFPAYPISYKTPEAERDRFVRLHADGSIKVLLSAYALAEGFDQPRAETALMVRPTGSNLLYSQMVGRVLRPWPSPEDRAAMLARGEPIKEEKRFARVLDFVDVSGKHSLNTVPSLFGLSSKFDTKGEPISKVLKRIDELSDKLVKSGANAATAESMDQLISMAQRVDLFAEPTVPEELQTVSQLIWLPAGINQYRLNMSSGQSYLVCQDTLGHATLYMYKDGYRVLLGEKATLEEAIQVADSRVPDYELTLLKNDSKWRKEPPSDKQIELLWKLKKKEFQPRFGNDTKAFADHVRNNFSKGAVSNMISEKMAQRGPARKAG